MRQAPVKRWAANETSRLLMQQLGLSATFHVELSLIPLRLQILDLEVRDRATPEPAIHAESVVVAPRFFSLLAGRIDVGDIEVENAAVRLDVQQGVVQNIALRIPDREGPSSELERSPFRTLAITNANLDLHVDDKHVSVEGLDLDAIAERDLTFDVALRVSGAELNSKRALPNGPPNQQDWAFDDDRLCSLELRARVDERSVDVRRFSLTAALDTEASSDLGAQCDGLPEHLLAIRLARFSVTNLERKLPTLRGDAMIKVPLMGLDRIAPGLHGEGWAGFSGSVAYGSEMRLPELNGKLNGERMKVAGYKIADYLSAEVLISRDVVFVPNMTAGWGNGHAEIEQLQVAPFVEKMPLEIGHISTRGVDLPGVLREILMTEHSWVDWNFGETEIDRVRGTVWPFFIDGGVEGHTRDFVVWDRGFDDPARRRMFGIPAANVKGRFRAHTRSLDFYDCDLRFGTSQVPVELVSIGFFPNELTVRTRPAGADIDLRELGPIADVVLGGKSHLFVDLHGPMTHPILKGTLSAEELSIADFSAGNVEKSAVHFEPLFLEFSDLVGNKGAMDYHLPRARLSFDGPAAVEFTGDVSSSNFLLSEFLNVFHFDEDPRFTALTAAGKVNGRVRYLLGGPEDRCGQGRLLVHGSAQLSSARLLDEEFSSGQGNFGLDWTDIEAGLTGLSLDIQGATLRKGSGSLFGSISVHPGGELSGDVIGTKIPLARLNLLPDELKAFDGTLTGSAQLSGTLQALLIDSEVSLSAVKLGQGTLPPSQLSVHLARDAAPASKARQTRCGHPVFDAQASAAGSRAGELKIVGQLFGSTVMLNDITLIQQKDPVVTGEIVFKGVDLDQLDALTRGPGQPPRVSDGQLDGKLILEEFQVNAPFSSRGLLQLDHVELTSSEIDFSLAQGPLVVRVSERLLKSENFAIEARAKSGQSGILDAEFTLDSARQLVASLRLRPTNLAVLAAATPMIERADGLLTLAMDVRGPLREPVVRGDVEVQAGLLKFSGLPDPVEDLNLHAALDREGIHLDRGSARFAGGEVTFKGELPVNDWALGQLELGVSARGVHYKSPDEVQVALDAELKVLALRSQGAQAQLPSVSGTVDILSADYRKPMSLTADISTLTTRGEKTEISGYDTEKDNVELDLLIRSSRALTVRNELVQATLLLDPSGLRLSGTDQRLGAVGTVEVQDGGRIFLRRNEFEVTTGLVRFNDPTRLRPEVDVSAVTEYRRYNTLSGAPGQSGQNDSTASTVGSGNWRISMRAYGPPDNLKVDLTSDPPLGQDDIFLLLTVGLTRTELDQSRNSGVGSSVALEALGTLSGAESAVTDVVPVDEFRFGSTYSSRSGRTEPTVTIGKRLSDRIRASVTTSLSETSEIRSNVEYRATQNVSVEGSFDNARNVASAAGGNLGGDVRWRIEFR